MDDSLGWIKLHRSLKEHWLWRDPQKALWWIDLLLTANWDDSRTVVGNSVVEIKKGQMLASNSFLSKRWGVHPDTIRSFLRLLEADGMIVQKTYPKYNVLTICNYERYQGINEVTTNPYNNLFNNAQCNTETDPIKEDKNIRNNNKDTNVSLSESNSDDDIDYKKLIAYWNEKTNGIWGTLRDIKNNRLKMVRARVKEYGKRALFDAINTACESSYLRGVTWFNFDWLIRPNNFDKLVSGNYNHEQRAQLQLELNSVKLGKGEQIDNQGNRFYMQGKTKVIVPFDAEPRPSEGHYWSESRKTWYYNGM